MQIGVQARSTDCMCWVCGIILEEGMPCILSYMTVMALKLWNGESAIKERQPDIFLIATDREYRVENYIEFGIGHFRWNPIFI